MPSVRAKPRLPLSSRPSWLLLAFLALSLAPFESHAAPRGRQVADSVGSARTLVRWAEEELGNASIESRQRAIRDLTRAADLDPSSATPWLRLGNAYELGGFRQMSRESYAHATRLAPRDPAGYMLLAMGWQREWVATLDTAALSHAIAALDTTVRLRPRASEPWLRLVPLRYEHGDRAGAADAAERALNGSPRRPTGLLAYAYTCFRRGDIERSDSAFAAALPQLEPTLRALFDRPAWIGLGTQGPSAAAGGAGADPWSGLDPDPTTNQNELRLEYWSRVAHAFFVFFDPLRPELDARAETYVRYGPPKGIALNPLGTSTAFQYGAPGGNSGRHIMMEYPLDALVWSYPELGMRVVLHDRSLTGSYQHAATRDFDPRSVPDPMMLAQRTDLVSMGNGVAVFSTLPPRDQRLDVHGMIARFEGSQRPRLMAQVQAPGAPGDSLFATFVVLDTTGREITRDTHALGLSACDPSARRVAEFSAELPAEEFQVVISVRDRHRHRGLYRTSTVLSSMTPALSLSDVVLACGDAAAMHSGSSVRIEANTERQVTGNRPLVAYFEIYHLATGTDGQARFEYEYAVRHEAEGPRGIAKLFVKNEPALITSSSREETQVGALRRQLVSVPMQALAPGRYRLEIRVRDLVTGTEASGEVDFVRE